MLVAAPCQPPGPPGPPLVGHALAYYRDPLRFLPRLAREYGDLVRFRVGRRDVYLLNHPDWIRDLLVTHHGAVMKGRLLRQSKVVMGEGLLTIDGAEHRRHRRLAQPAFHRERVRAYGAIMTDHAARLGAAWRTGATVDIGREMTRLTLPIVVRTLLGAEADLRPIVAPLVATRTYFQAVMLSAAAVRARLPLPSVLRARRGLARLDAALARIIAERRARGEDRGDVLSTLLLARDEDGRGLADREVRDELVTLLLAGHETTAAALTWTWYLLARHPAAEAALHAELAAALAGRPPTADDLPRLPCARMILAEAMRLYPPLWIVARRALRDCRFGPYGVPAGSTILASQFVMHRDPRYYPDPSRFDPTRWTPERQARRPRFSYFPFGGGPRGCIGEPFAWTAGVLLLATLAQGWRPRLVPGRRVEPEPRITLRPKRGVWMTLERRPAVRGGLG